MLKLKGLKKIASESKRLNPYGSEHLQVNVNRNSGEVWCNSHVGNSWTEYHDPAVLRCGFLTAPATMEEIKQMVYESISYAAMF